MRRRDCTASLRTQFTGLHNTTSLALHPENEGRKILACLEETPAAIACTAPPRISEMFF